MATVNWYKIASCIKAYKRYEKGVGEYDTAWNEWKLAHQSKCEAKEGLGKCPLQPDAPEEPLLNDY